MATLSTPAEGKVARAIASGNVLLLGQTLRSFPALLGGVFTVIDPDATTRTATALILAAEHEQHRCLNLLISLGAPVDGASHEGWTPLLEAASFGTEACVSALCDAGASVNLANGVGETPLMAAASGDSLACVAALIKYGARLEARDALGATALIHAARENASECVEALLFAGAKLNATTNAGGTAKSEAKARKAKMALAALSAGKKRRKGAKARQREAVAQATDMGVIFNKGFSDVYAAENDAAASSQRSDADRKVEVAQVAEQEAHARSTLVASAASEAAVSERVARIHADVLQMGARMVGSDIRRRFMRWKAFVQMVRTDNRMEAAAEHARVAKALRAESAVLQAAREAAVLESDQLRAEVAAAAAQREAAVLESKRLREEAGAVDAEHARSAATLQSEATELRLAHEHAVRERDALHAALAEHRRESLAQHSRATTAHKLQLDAALAVLKEEHESRTQELTAAHAKKAQDAIAVLQEQDSELESMHTELEEHRDIAASREVEVARTLENLKAEHDARLAERLAAKEHEMLTVVRAQDEELEALQTELAKQEDGADENRVEDVLAPLRAELDDCHDAAAAHDSEMAALTAELAEARGSIASRDDELRSVEAELNKAKMIVADFEEALKHERAAAEVAEIERVARIHANVLRMGARMVGTDIRRRFMRWKGFVDMKRVEKRKAAAAEHVRVAETLRGEAKELAAEHERATRKSGQRSEAALAVLQGELKASRESVANRDNDLSAVRGELIEAKELAAAHERATRNSGQRSEAALAVLQGELKASRESVANRDNDLSAVRGELIKAKSNSAELEAELKASREAEELTAERLAAACESKASLVELQAEFDAFRSTRDNELNVVRGELIKVNSIVADFEQASQHKLAEAEAAERVRVARINANVLRMGARIDVSDVRLRFMRWKAFVEMIRMGKRKAAAAEHARVAEALRGEAEELATMRETTARESEAALLVLQEELKASRESVAARDSELSVMREELIEAKSNFEELEKKKTAAQHSESHGSPLRLDSATTLACTDSLASTVARALDEARVVIQNRAALESEQQLCAMNEMRETAVREAREEQSQECVAQLSSLVPAFIDLQKSVADREEAARQVARSVQSQEFAAQLSSLVPALVGDFEKSVADGVARANDASSSAATPPPIPLRVRPSLSPTATWRSDEPASPLLPRLFAQQRTSLLTERADDVVPSIEMPRSPLTSPSSRYAALLVRKLDVALSTPNKQAFPSLQAAKYRSAVIRTSPILSPGRWSPARSSLGSSPLYGALPAELTARIQANDLLLFGDNK